MACISYILVLVEHPAITYESLLKPYVWALIGIDLMKSLFVGQ